MRGAPEANAHPFVTRAYETLHDPATVWRIRYQLAPTDPRYLSITEEELLADLMTLAFHDDAQRRAVDPTPPEADDPEAIARYDERKKEVLASDLTRRLETLLRGKPETTRPMTVSIRGWGGQ